MKWFESHDNRIELAHWLLVDGWFTYPIDMLRYFEKPWKWTAEWDKMNAGPTEEQLGLDDPEQWAKTDPPWETPWGKVEVNETPDGFGVEIIHHDRTEEEEDLRPTDLILATDPGWITP